MRELIPEIHVYPYRLIDGGLPVWRAKFMLNLMRFLPASSRLPGPAAAFQLELIVDLFDKPQREQIRDAVVAGMQLSGMTYKALALQSGALLSVVRRREQRGGEEWNCELSPHLVFVTSAVYFAVSSSRRSTVT